METIKLGSRGEAVKTAQKALNVYPDGIFGQITLEAVKEYQKEQKAAGKYTGAIDGIIGSKTWALLLAGDTSGASAAVALPTLKKSKRSIKRLIVHCTATKEGQHVTVDKVRDWHTKPLSQGGRGWSDIGYHYLIYLDGTLKLGRDVDISGAHTANYNATSIGICYVGGLDSNGKAKDTRTEAQKKTLVELLIKLRILYPSATIHGHREFANKACPCFDAKAEYQNI